MIDENTPTSEYAPFRDTSLHWVILNPDDIDFPGVTRIDSISGDDVYLYHETFEENRRLVAFKSDILRLATKEEIYSDIPNYDIEVSNS